MILIKKINDAITINYFFGCLRIFSDKIEFTMI